MSDMWLNLLTLTVMLIMIMKACRCRINIWCRGCTHEKHIISTNITAYSPIILWRLLTRNVIHILHEVEVKYELMNKWNNLEELVWLWTHNYSCLHFNVTHLILFIKCSRMFCWMWDDVLWTLFVVVITAKLHFCVYSYKREIKSYNNLRSMKSFVHTHQWHYRNITVLNAIVINKEEMYILVRHKTNRSSALC